MNEKRNLTFYAKPFLIFGLVFALVFALVLYQDHRGRHAVAAQSVGASTHGSSDIDRPDCSKEYAAWVKADLAYAHAAREHNAADKALTSAENALTSAENALTAAEVAVSNQWTAIAAYLATWGFTIVASASAGTVVVPGLGTISGSAAAFLFGLPGLSIMAGELIFLNLREGRARKARDEAEEARDEAKSEEEAAYTEKVRTEHEKNVAWAQYQACLAGAKI